MPIDLGDLYLADVGRERREVVLVVSNARFARESGRVLVAIELAGGPTEEFAPWHVPVGDRLFTVELMRSLPVDRLLELQGRAPHGSISAARRAIQGIT